VYVNIHHLYFSLYCLRNMTTMPFSLLHLSLTYLLAIPAASALARIFAPTLRIFIAARSIPPFLALSYILRAVSRLSAVLLVTTPLHSWDKERTRERDEASSGN
jgi:hypothetical protein